MTDDVSWIGVIFGLLPVVVFVGGYNDLLDSVKDVVPFHEAVALSFMLSMIIYAYCHWFDIRMGDAA